ncbi:hypothetical protein OG196_43540 (plasmid) [Kitasatospora purpeofusca]|uniref:hypothetical protein n=1 Tax=Kitasatospora purpeofusca TaxID=67352 RepID=UPI002E0FB723|nr:hypothetical protein OG196_43540 [Kitasatospora purpeofusca]
MTIIVDGQTVTGTVISKDLWKSLWLDEIKSAGKGGEFMAEIIEGLDGMNYMITDGEIVGRDRPLRLHMKDAHFGNNGPKLLRVRIDRISAWSVGIAQRDA